MMMEILTMLLIVVNLGEMLALLVLMMWYLFDEKLQTIRRNAGKTSASECRGGCARLDRKISR